MKITKDYLSGLSHEQKDEIILRQAEEIETLKTQVAYLMNVIEELKKEIAELKSGKTKKTSQNSSVTDGIRASDIVESDETSCRVKAKKWWEWVFHNAQYCLHVIRNSRGADVPREILGEHRPTYWASDLYSAQKGHADKWQICLAHQLRDCQFAIDNGDKGFSWRMQKLFFRAIQLGKSRKNIKESSRKAHKRKLLKELDWILEKSNPQTKEGKNLKRRYTQHRDSLFTFFDDVRMEPTNNGSERKLRPGVIFRKVTNCFRSSWGAELYAGVRSVVDTGKLQGKSAMQSIQDVIIPTTSHA